MTQDVIHSVPKRVCKVCGEEKPLASFPQAKGYKLGRRPQCSQCFRRCVYQWTVGTPERRARRNSLQLEWVHSQIKRPEYRERIRLYKLALRRRKGEIPVDEYREARRKGLVMAGHKLDEGGVIQLRTLHDLGAASAMLGRLFDISAQAITTGRSWQHITHRLSKSSLTVAIASRCNSDTGFRIRLLRLFVEVALQQITKKHDQRKTELLEWFRELRPLI